MSKDSCSICLEQFEDHHTIAKPEPCCHPFPIICISIWLRRQSTCPICRSNIHYEAKVPWNTLFAVAVIFTQQQYIDRSLCAIAFLDIILRQYRNAREFKKHLETIVKAIENIQITNTKLPFLVIPTRADALKEKRKWRKSAEDLLNMRVSRKRLIPYYESIQGLI